MATQTLKIAENNTAPPLVLTCKRGNTAIDVTACTVQLYITQNGTQTNTGHENCTITTATSGIVSYVPRSTDFPTAGTYLCDVKITYADTTSEVLYDQLKVKARKRLLSAS